MFLDSQHRTVAQTFLQHFVQNQALVNPVLAGWRAKDHPFQDKSKKSYKCSGPHEILKRSDLLLCGVFYQEIFTGICCIHRKWVFLFLPVVMQSHTWKELYVPSHLRHLWSLPSWICTFPPSTALMYSQKSRCLNIKWTLYITHVTELGYTALFSKFWLPGVCKTPEHLDCICFAGHLQNTPPLPPDFVLRAIIFYRTDRTSVFQHCELK